MTRKDILLSIRELSSALHARDIITVAENVHPSDLAEALSLLPLSTILSLTGRLDSEKKACLFSYFSEPLQKSLLSAMTVDEAAELFEHLPADDRADIFALLDKPLREKILPALRQETRNDLLRLSSFPEDSTGAATTSEFLSVLPETRVAAALRTVRAAARSSETVYIVYVLDRDGHLLGTVSLKELLLADDDVAVADIMRRHPVCVRSSWPRARSAEMIRRYDLLALPVMDENNRMLGIITVDDALDIEKEQEATRLARFGGTAPAGDTDLDILQSPLRTMFKVRVFWLIFLTIFGVVTSTFVAAQEELLSRVIVLAAFIAPIVDMGGNTGSQSATLVIRAMSMGDVTLRWRDVWSVVRREIPVACALGLAVAVLEGVLAFFSKSVGMDVIMVVGLSMLVCTAAGGLIGILLPFLARRIGTDPATLSSPLITSIMDLFGVFIYFGFAHLFLADLLNAV